MFSLSVPYVLTWDKCLHNLMPMRVDELLLDLHIGAVAHDALDHRRHFRGGDRFELRVDTDGVLFHAG